MLLLIYMHAPGNIEAVKEVSNDGWERCGHNLVRFWIELDLNLEISLIYINFKIQ